MCANRLANARSPYLRMHADDPVDWFPWGEEAFARARETDRPIFLSSGYAACHWCHVMQRESFADPATAEQLNAGFVSVKVDRELRPDVDALYMEYVSATTGRGGWPMSVFLTPDGAPILGGTYFPPERQGRMPSFRDVLATVSDIWRDERGRAEAAAEAALAYLREEAEPERAEAPSPELLDRTVDIVLRSADPVHGGFGTAPKFPQAPLLLFLLDRAAEGDGDALLHVERTVRGIVRGGIYDQAGGGMSRYATDDEWLVPHFEKMLYDNALLLSVLGRLYALAPADEWAHAARRTAAFLQRDLAAKDGAFYAALSADTEGVEGATYVWTYEQLAETLTADELALAERYLGVTQRGNWEGANILTRPDGRSGEPEAVDRVLEHILRERRERPRPDVDTKVLTSWNALAARGLIDAGRTMEDPEATALGLATLRALLAAAPGDDVPHELGGDEAGVRLLEDYAALTAACLTAYEALGDDAWLSDAARLHAATLGRFGDGDVLYMSPPDVDLPLRPREQGDMPTPSGASTTVENALRLYEATLDESYRAWAERALRYVMAPAAYAPQFSGTALSAALRWLQEAALPVVRR
jgi:uncharacterized protein